MNRGAEMRRFFSFASHSSIRSRKNFPPDKWNPEAADIV
jgi:hypothetical protein